MKEVPYWRWYTWNNQRTKRTATKYHMDEETAMATDPGATKVPGSLIVRHHPENDSEIEYTSRIQRRPPE
jgi:hypothetical protein